MKTIYAYYLVSIDDTTVERFPSVEPENIQTIDGREFVLYAYTTKRKKADEFELFRDMNIFVRKIYVMTEEEYNDFRTAHEECYLDYYHIKTKSIQKGIYRPTDIQVLGTMREIDIVEESTIFDTMDDYTLFKYDEDFNRSIFSSFKNKLSKALDFLLFYSFIEYCYPMETDIDDMTSVDQLSVFLRVCGFTFKR